MASCSFWARRLLPPRMATCVHTRHMGLTSWHIPGSGASRGEEGHRTRGKATGQRSKEKGSEVNVHSRSPLRRVSGGQGRRGEHAGSERDMVSVGPGVPSHPNPVLASKTENQGSKAEFRPLALAFVGTTLLWSWGHWGSRLSSGPWKDFHSRTQKPMLGVVAGGSSVPPARAGPAAQGSVPRGHQLPAPWREGH